jgi:hypothetical protein
MKIGIVQFWFTRRGFLSVKDSVHDFRIYSDCLSYNLLFVSVVLKPIIQTLLKPKIHPNRE